MEEEAKEYFNLDQDGEMSPDRPGEKTPDNRKGIANIFKLNNSIKSNEKQLNSSDGSFTSQA